MHGVPLGTEETACGWGRAGGVIGSSSSGTALGAAGVPQTSQYPSRMVPVQPGSVQVAVVLVTAVLPSS